MTCGLCHSPTRDKAYVCDPCGDNLANDLRDLTDWLAEDIDTSVGGAKAASYAGRTGGGEAGLRVNWRAAQLHRDLGKALADAVDHCLAVNVRHSSVVDDAPPRTIPLMALWLTWRIDGLCLDIGAAEHVGAIHRLAQSAREVVFWKPPERHYLGECEICGAGGSVYVEGDDEQAICDRCEKAFPAEARRSKLLQALDDRLVTAAEAARLSTYLNLSLDRGRVHARIRSWGSRGRIEKVSGEGEATRYRFGDILLLLTAG